VLAAVLAGVAVLAVVVARLWLGLADWLAGVGRAVLALSDAALVVLVVLELRQRDDLHRNVDLAGPALAEVTVLDEVSEVLAALLADFAESIEVVSQSHL